MVPAAYREIECQEWPPATTPTTSGPNLRTLCTCSGSTGSAMPMMMKDRKTTAMTGTAGVIESQLLEVFNCFVKADTCMNGSLAKVNDAFVIAHGRCIPCPSLV